MAVTANINTIGASLQLRRVSFSAFVSSQVIIDGVFSIPSITMDAALSNKFSADINNISITGSGNASFKIAGLFTGNKISISGSVATISNIIGIATPVNKISISGICVSGKGIYGVGVVPNVTSIGTGSISNGIIGILNSIPRLFLVANGSMSSSILPAPDIDSDIPQGNNYVVVNLRTKAHCLYRDGDTKCYARTANMNFASHKSKVVGDIIVFGRASDAIKAIIYSDEQTKRSYDLTFKSSDGNNLKNKRVKTNRGIKGASHQLAVASDNGVYNELRSVDMFVSELKRHI